MDKKIKVFAVICEIIKIANVTGMIETDGYKTINGYNATQYDKAMLITTQNISIVFFNDEHNTFDGEFSRVSFNNNNFDIYCDEKTIEINYVNEKIINVPVRFIGASPDEIGDRMYAWFNSITIQHFV